MSFPASSPPGDPPQAAAWLGQCGIYLLIMVLEKGVISLVLLVPGWSKVSKPYGCLCRVQVTLWKKNLTDWRSYCLSFQNCVTCASAEPVTKLNSMWPVHDDVSTDSSHLTLTETEVFSPFFFKWNILAWSTRLHEKNHSILRILSRFCFGLVCHFSGSSEGWKSSRVETE